MNLKKFTTEIVKQWTKRRIAEATLNGTMGVPQISINKRDGLKGEITVLNNLTRRFKDYKFALTDYSKTPADIIGLRKTSKFWHIALYQVKTSIDVQKLTPEIPEKYSLPILAEVIKEVFKISEQTNYYKKKQLFITVGYIGVFNSKTGNRIVTKVSYDGEKTMNKLSLTSSEKRELKKILHE